MSSSSAIAAITQKLELLLASLSPTAKPLDKASGSPLNIFLYNITINSAWRNQDLPSASRTGQPRRPLLPLNLYYLISACEDDQRRAHLNLGQAMLTLHDRPELKGFNSNSGIKNQVDPIRLTLQSLNIDEMSKLWSAFQTPYRPSVAYEAGVVLIESELSDVTPLPVTRRGSSGDGWDASTQFPAVLSSIEYAPQQPGARLGERITIHGQNLSQSGKVEVAFRHPTQTQPFFVTPEQLTDSELVVSIPDQANVWLAGIYMVSVQYTITDAVGEQRTAASLAIPFAILPEIAVPPTGQLTATHVGNDFSLVLPCKPKLGSGQQLQLLIGSTVVASFDRANASAPVAKWKKQDLKLTAGEMPYARLRVDGVDSLIHNPADLSRGFEQRFLVKGLT